MFSNSRLLTWILLAFIFVSMMLGFAVPAFYDWTDSDQSRMSPLMYQVPLGLVAAALVVCIGLLWLPIADSIDIAETKKRPRFSIKTLLIATALLAILFACFRQNPTFGSFLVSAMTFLYVAWKFALIAQMRLRVLALFACMSFPYIWTLGSERMEDLLTTIFFMVIGLPALLPTLLIGGAVGLHISKLYWLAPLLTSGQLLAGILVIGKGPRLAIVFLIAALISSSIGSLCLNALVRM